MFFTLNREDFSFVIHLDRQPRTSRRREAQTGSRARSGSRSERTLDAVEHSRTLMEWWPFLIFHRGGLRIKVINNNPAAPLRCFSRFFPKGIGLASDVTSSARQKITSQCNFSDAALLGAAVIPLCSGSHTCSTPRLHPPLRIPLAGRPGLLRHAMPIWLPNMSRGIATCLNRAIGTAGLPPAGLRPCRLLPTSPSPTSTSCIFMAPMQTALAPPCRTVATPCKTREQEKASVVYHFNP